MSDAAVLDVTKVTPVKPKEEEKNDDKHGAAPPVNGLCRRCGNFRPINRLMLCYRCWVITNLEDEAKKRGESWHEGDPHPEGCQCQGLGEHKHKDDTARGVN